MTTAFTLITWGICFSSRLTLMNSTILSKRKLGFQLRRKPKDKHETVDFSRESRLDASISTRARIKMAWENIRHFGTLPLVSLRTRADIPNWWHTITRILAEPLIDWKFASTIRSITQIWVETRHQYGISALVSQTSFRGETSDSLEKHRLFYQIKIKISPLFSSCFRF